MTEALNDETFELDEESTRPADASALTGPVQVKIINITESSDIAPTATVEKQKPTAPTISAPPTKNLSRVVRTVSSDSCSPQSFIENTEEIYTLKKLLWIHGRGSYSLHAQHQDVGYGYLALRCSRPAIQTSKT
jgi:hypothetical protein